MKGLLYIALHLRLGTVPANMQKSQTNPLVFQDTKCQRILLILLFSIASSILLVSNTTVDDRGLIVFTPDLADFICNFLLKKYL